LSVFHRRPRHHRALHPFPTRRSSDLSIAPNGLKHVLFANSGSEANDSAVKMVWYYHNAIGKPQKKKIIGRQFGYHGVTVASGSLDRKSTRLNSSHVKISYAVFCLKKK